MSAFAATRERSPIAISPLAGPNRPTSGARPSGPQLADPQSDRGGRPLLRFNSSQLLEQERSCLDGATKSHFDPERTWTLEIRLQSIGRRDSLLKGKMTPRLGDKAHDTARFHQTYYYVACIPSDRGNGPAINPGYWSLISQYSYGIGLRLLCWIFPGNARTRVCRGKGLSNRVAICGGRLHTPFCAGRRACRAEGQRSFRNEQPIDSGRARGDDHDSYRDGILRGRPDRTRPCCKSCSPDRERYRTSYNAVGRRLKGLGSHQNYSSKP